MLPLRAAEDGDVQHLWPSPGLRAGGVEPLDLPQQAVHPLREWNDARCTGLPGFTALSRRVRTQPTS